MTGYRRVCLSKNGKGFVRKVHKLVAITFLGHIPCGMTEIVDHIDRDKLNNKLDNIRLVNSRESSHNRSVKKTSKYIGVSWSKQAKKWHSRIDINGKDKHLGYFMDEIDASNAYQNALDRI